MVFNREILVKKFHVYREKIIQMQRFSLWFKLLLLSPALMWFIEFNLSKFIPERIRPQVDTTTLPYLDSRILYGYTLLHWPRNILEDNPDFNGLVAFLDMLSALVYIIHFCFVWFFAIGIYFYYRKKVDANGKPLLNPWTFFWCWGLLNFVSVTAQLVWPTAPPWYVELYGTKPPSYSMGGSPAGLANADNILRFKLFAMVYGNSPVVFGSFPSLHGAWPIMITIFTPNGKRFKIAGAIYASLVWWAAMYLNHHYLTDLLGGLFFVIITYLGGLVSLHFFVNYFKDRIYGKASKVVRYSEAAELELIVQENRPSSDDESLPRSPKMKKTPSRDDTSSIPLLDEASLKIVIPDNSLIKANEKHL